MKKKIAKAIKDLKKKDERYVKLSVGKIEPTGTEFDYNFMPKVGGEQTEVYKN